MIFEVRLKDMTDAWIETSVPVAMTTDKTKALLHEIEVEPIDDDEFDAFWKDLSACIDEKNTMDWKINICAAEGGTFLGELITSSDGITWGHSSSADATTARLLWAFADYLKDYMLSKAIEQASKSMAGLAVSSTASTSTTPSAGAAISTGTTDEETEKLIETIKSKTKADIVKPKETLKDYVCDDCLMDELKDVKSFFEDSKTYAAMGIRIPKGILFKGLPGTGKTYAARCIAGDTDCWFMTCTASALQGQYIGSGAENIRNVFKGAKTLYDKTGKGVIIFLDELDSFGSRDSHKNGGAGGEEDRTLNQLLAEMSGFEDNDGIMILGATNYADRLDDALLRSGRFSRQIEITLPNEAQRDMLCEFYLNKIKIPLGGGITYAAVSNLCRGMTPADISEIANEAGILAIRRKLSILSEDVIDEAINKVITKNIRKPDKDMEFQHLVAVHECGHVLAEVLYSNRYPVKVTNYSYGNAGGFTQPSERMEGIITRDKYLSEVYGLLGGRCAETVALGYYTTGASEDLTRATKMLKAYFEVYHFEKYEIEKLEQTVEDFRNKMTQEVIELFRNPTQRVYLNKLISELESKRTLFTPDISKIVPIKVC